MSAVSRVARFRAGAAIPRSVVPDLPWDDFADVLLGAVAAGLRVAAYFGAADRGSVRFHLVLADDQDSTLSTCSTGVQGAAFPSLTRQCPQVHLFEREIAEQFGLEPEGHPWRKPVRFEPRNGLAAGVRVIGETPAGSHATEVLPGVIDFYRVEGSEVHEVGVGPVHAGVIEPGHFRFQCHGEQVFHLEISLGYQHRGIERALAGGPDRRSVHYLETAAGDTTIGHVTAHSEIVEALTGTRPPPRGLAIRGIGLELERLANHVGDLGALAGDVGFLSTASFCGRLRGDFLNLSAEICGSRFGRGMVRPGGAAFDVDERLAARLIERLDQAMADTRAAVDLLWEAPSVMERFEGTGPVPADVAALLGLTGPAARASGIDRDSRRDHPSGIFRFHHLPVALADTGDVFARAYVRWLEIQRSAAFVRESLGALPGGPVSSAVSAIGASSIAVSLVEGWRGTIGHVALTDDAGRFARYKVVDPSFQNWSAVAYALRGQQISDFPLCNKSFNLSYCGFDL